MKVIAAQIFFYYSTRVESEIANVKFVRKLNKIKRQKIIPKKPNGHETESKKIRRCIWAFIPNTSANI